MDECETFEVRGRGAQPAPSPEGPPELANHPRYRIKRLLGKGGMGAVYEAEHCVMKRLVALKVIAANLVTDPSAGVRFRREVQVAAQLNHANIVTAHDADEANGCYFLVMELVDGVNLDRLVKRKGPLALPFACDYVRQVALGLQHAHEKGMVHRDIKPHNLMLTRKGQVKILDFGLARFVSENTSTSAVTGCGLMGTPDFIAPEQAEDAHGADIRADVYSLGCTLYFLLTGRTPFPEGSILSKVLAHAQREPIPLSDFRADLPVDLIAIISRMMAKSPDDRFQTPSEVARALLPFRKTGTPSQPPPSVKREAIRSLPAPLVPEEPRASEEASDRMTKVEQRLRPAAALEKEPEECTIPATSRPRRRPRVRRRTSRWPWFLGIAVVVLVGAVLVAIPFLRRKPASPADETVAPGPVNVPAPGRVLVFCRDPNLRLAIRRGGEVADTISPGTNPQAELPPGDYTLEIVGGAPELRGFTGKLSLGRGDRKYVEVRLEGIFVHDSPPSRPGPPDHPPDGPPDGPPDRRPPPPRDREPWR
jgi:serine/threonine protein kinase